MGSLPVNDRAAPTQAVARALAAARLRYDLLRAIHDAVDACGGPEAFAKKAGVRAGLVRRVLDGDGNVRINLLAHWLHTAGYELVVRLVPAGAPRRAVIEERDGLREETEALLAPTKYGRPGVEWAPGREQADGALPRMLPEVEARRTVAHWRATGHVPDAVLLRREHTAWHRWPLDEEEADQLAPE